MKIIPLLFLLLVLNNVNAQWQSTTGPYLASANIAMDVSNVEVSGNNLCALIANRIYLSNNNGASWMYASNGINYVRSYVFTDSIIYAGTSNGIYYSSNWGSTYALLNGLPSGLRIDALHKEGSMIVSAVYNNSTSLTDVYFSTNDGNTWTLSNGLNNKQTQCFASSGNKLYAGTWNGVYMSTDSGLNWNLIGLNSYTIKAIAVESNRIFVSDNSSGGAFYFSQNDGGNWTSVNSGLPAYIGSIAIAGTNVYAGAYWNGVYRSIDNGANWTFLNSPCGFMDIKTVAAAGNNVYAGSSDGFSASTNQGNSWICNNLKTYNLNINSIISPPNNLITTTEYGNYNSTNNGNTWHQDLIVRHVIATNDSIVLSGGNGAISRSLDFGNSWTNAYSLPGSPPVSSIIFKDSVAFAATLDSGIYFSKDYGLHWIQRNNGLSSKNINSLTFTDSIVVAGSDNAGVFISSDSGQNWNVANNGLPDTCIQSLAAYFDILYAGSKNNGIYKSVDNGTNWMQLTTGLPDTNVACLYSCGENVFAGIRGRGFLMSVDNGANWFPSNNGLMNYNIETISENGSDIFVGTGGYYNNGGGIWKRSLSDLPLTLSIKKMDVSPKEVCEGSSSTIIATAIGGTPPYSYSWNNGSQSSSITVTPTSTTSYTLTVNDANNNSTSIQTTIVVKPKPAKPVITRSGDTLISSSATGNYWLYNNTYIPNATSNQYIVYQPGYYTVVVIDNGCASDPSIAVQVVGVDEINNVRVALFPNPFTDRIKIETDDNNICEIILSDVLSREVINQSFIKTTLINTSQLASGIYTYTVKNKNGLIRKGKIVKE